LAIVLANWYRIRAKNGSPRTLAELAQMLGLPVWTLLRVKHSPEFENTIRKDVRAMYTEAIIQITEALITKATKGSAPHIRLFFEYAERLGVFEMSPRHSE
jgi:hypothetical protein